MRTIWKALTCVALATSALAGCGGGDDNGPKTGTLAVSMTDSPACGFDHVYVTVTQVRVNSSSTAGDNDTGWASIVLPTPQKIDLLSLTNGVLANLGQTALPAGQYQQVRLVLAQNTGNTLANSVVVSGSTTEQALATPSASQSGYKIIRPFTVDPNTLVDLILDFNACKSIVTQGNGSYALKPVVTATPTTVSGEISGYVAPAEAGATVYAEQGGKVVTGTIADSTGKFVLMPLVQSSTQGNYDVVIAQNGFASGIVQSVPVVVNSNTAISTQTAPITLPASTMQTVSGTVTASADAAVRALQPVGSGSFEIASTNADLVSGAYSLTLPQAAPLAGTYSGTLPVAMAAVAASAGVYNIEADAASGATQTTAVNISGGAQTVNFTF